MESVPKLGAGNKVEYWANILVLLLYFRFCFHVSLLLIRKWKCHKLESSTHTQSEPLLSRSWIIGKDDNFFIFKLFLWCVKYILWRPSSLNKTFLKHYKEMWNWLFTSFLFQLIVLGWLGQEWLIKFFPLGFS